MGFDGFAKSFWIGSKGCVQNRLMFFHTFAVPIMGLIEVCAGRECEGLQIFEDFHSFLIAGSSQIQHMEFQIQPEIAFCVHSGIIAGNKLFLFFHVFQKLLAQGTVVIEGGDDIFDEECVHHQTDVKGIVQFMGRQCASPF